MFERLTEQRWALTACLSDRTYTKIADARVLEIKDEQWAAMEEMCECLKPLQMAMTELSTENKVSISSVAPIIISLINQHLIDKENDSSTVKVYKKHVAENLKRRFSGLFFINGFENTIGQVYLIASFLDPRYKNLKFLNAELKKSVLDKVTFLLENQVVERAQVQPSKRQKLSDVEDSQFSRSALDILLGNNNNDSETLDGSLTNEMEIYRSTAQVSTNEDPLKWWERHCNLFPNLAKLADAYLSVPATSVPSERMFSSAGRLITKLRNRQP